ncbi:MAG: hypothetical protein HN742_28595 [Lentisphaerae bacterium]|jgi:hypothetical protein|nr:hypothetical protein [Lentisphaerota bacterium]MBT4817034.1 hypothetical protein [Lentisphaerota bacterium]MBT5612223.1 hypothetical protein [Lentisphaerota bacterium]MBT7845866.1 hypothetical protein [Lentisphaerota bacterium]
MMWLKSVSLVGLVGSVALLACCGCQGAEGDAADLYVSPAGNDAWSGTLPDTSAAGNDGPFRTLERAKTEVRKLKVSDAVTVELRAGTYELTTCFTLTTKDSGTAEAPVTYRAQPGAVVRLLGGKRVSDLTPVTDPTILEMLPADARKRVFQANLRAQGLSDYGQPVEGGMEVFFDAQPMTLSRWPNDDFTRIVKMVGEASKWDRGMTHRVGKWVYDGDRPTRWAKEKDVWVHGYWFFDWATQRHRIKAIDTESRTLEVHPPYHGYGYRKGKWYYAYNLLSEIDSPGEWYMDRDAGILYFWPPKAVDSCDTIVSVLPTLIAFDKASHITLHGLLLEGSRGTAVSVSGGASNRIVACTMRNLGGWAVRVGGGKNHGVIGCDISATGQGGIYLSGGDRKSLEPASHFAENNHIHHYARIRRMGQPGIGLQGVGSRASHNLIHNAPHQAMNFGGNDHIIEFNEMHSVCFESNDAGAIYAGRNWTMRGNILRHNYLHHINGFEGRGCVGVYLDDSFSSAHIHGNVFYKVTRATMIGGGRDTTIENNIFVDCTPAVHVDARGVGWANRYIVPGGGWHMQKKLADVPYQAAPWTKYPNLAGILEDEPYLPKHNVVARNIFVGGKWDGIRGKAKPLVILEGNMIDEDVGFVDLTKDDLRLREDSPAYAKGFVRIPFDKIGLHADSRRASWPVTHSVRPMATPPPPPDRGPVPVFKVSRATATITIDGQLSAAEWQGLDVKQAMVVEQGIRGEKLALKTYAWLAHDGTHLHIAVRNLVAPDSKLHTGAVWGQDDAIELAMRNPFVKGASILVLRGYALGQFESSTEAGAPFEVSKDIEKAAIYGATIVSKSEWTAEWRIPLPALGLSPGKKAPLPFNLSIRKTCGPHWVMWRGTLGATWDIDQAGLLQLD